MWSNFKSIANEALEAARDIKEHISEVTSAEHGEEEQSHYENELERSYMRSMSLEKDLNRVQEESQSRMSDLESEIVELKSLLAEQESIFTAKEADYQYRIERMDREIKELIRMKAQLTMELDKHSQEKQETSEFQAENTILSEEIKNLNSEIKESSETNQDLTAKIRRLEQLLDEQKQLNEDTVDKRFFLQVLQTFSKNYENYDSRIRILENIGDVLGLTVPEKEMIGIPSKKPPAPTEEEDEPSIFDKFSRFLIS